MDSMRSLNSSLPSSQPSRSAPPEELLQAFRTAALSVTNLYKSAATTQANARLAGYQDALEDLLKFLDKENLGLQDGEGWRVRQWATARYDGTTTQLEEDEEEDREQYDTESGNANNPQDTDDAHIPQPPPDDDTHASRHDSEEDSGLAERSPVFHFTSNAQHDNNMQTDEVSSPQVIDEPSSSSSTPIRVEVLNRNGRPTSRSHPARPNAYSNPREFTFTAGTKRKLQFPDFFDISNWNDKKDGSGGGGGGGGGPKRGRFV